VKTHHQFEYIDVRGERNLNFCSLKKSDLSETPFRFHHDPSIEIDSRGTGWLHVIGTLTEEEDQCLLAAPSQVHAVMDWIFRLLAWMANNNIISTPPPIFSRVFQECSTAMIGYAQAYKIAILPFPRPIKSISVVFLFLAVVLLPFVIEEYTGGYLMTPLYTFMICLGYMSLELTARCLEHPYGDDYTDLPLRTMHEHLNCCLLYSRALCYNADPLDRFLTKKTVAVDFEQEKIPVEPVISANEEQGWDDGDNWADTTSSYKFGSAGSEGSERGFTV
jgi:hypothetical protein